jgi:two-component system cell cycle sensor histidine kinase/response regulator CckA
VRELATAILADAGYHVLAAESGDQALAVANAEEQAIDLLLTDVIMPGTSGPELAERLAPLPTLFMSGYTGDAITRHGLVPAQRDLLDKPFTPNLLLSTIRQILDRGLLEA